MSPAPIHHPGTSCRAKNSHGKCGCPSGECVQRPALGVKVDAPTFSAADVDEAAKHCGISDGHRDMLAGALRHMAAVLALRYCGGGSQ